MAGRRPARRGARDDEATAAAAPPARAPTRAPTGSPGRTTARQRPITAQAATMAAHARSVPSREGPVAAAMATTDNPTPAVATATPIHRVNGAVAAGIAPS